MTAFHRATRSAGLVLSSALLGAALAPAAHATDITNPAANPAPITVTIDGQTYRDGADTLPGYDDYACTPIPNVQYDFSNDEIQYYDGQGTLITTAHWTEWDRISSYQTWVDQQHAGTPSNTNNSTPSSGDATPTPAATGPAATSPTATSNATTSPTVKSKSSTTKTKSSTTKATNSPARTTTSATTTTSAAKTKSKRTPSSHRTTSKTPKKATTAHAKQHGAATGSPKKHAAAITQAAATDATGTAAPAGASAAAPSAAKGAAAPAPSAAGAPKYKLVSDKGAAAIGDTRPVGVGILVAVFAAAGLAFLIGSARRRRTFGGREGTGPYA